MTGKQLPKVAFVASIYRHFEAFHLPYMKLLQNKGYEVHAYAGDVHGKNDIEAANVICHDICIQRNPYKISNLKALRDLISSFKQEQFQMVHLHTPVAGILGRIAAKLADVPSVIYTAHGFHFYKGAPPFYWMIYYPIERLMARCTDYLITINQEDYRCAENFPVRQEVLYVPGVGIDSQVFHAQDDSAVRRKIRSKLEIKDEDFVILCPAEINANKNQIQLIKAVEKMAADNKNVQCLLAGSGNNEFLSNYVKQRSLESHVHFLGLRNDIAQLLEAADVVALLSKREGLSRALMEAMAVGKPIVATDIRGNKDLIQDGETGFLVPVGNVDATVNAFVKLADNPELRFEMGEKNKEQVNKYDIKNVLQYMEKIYSQALQNKKQCLLL